MPLTNEQRARSERNRQAALLLRVSRQQLHQQESSSSSQQLRTSLAGVAVAVGGGGGVADSCGGFMYDADEADGEASRRRPRRLVEEPAPLVDPNDLLCGDCGKPFHSSFPYDRFGVPACPLCYEASRDETYRLVARTDAKTRYLLKDADLDRREPPLRCILRRNPHNPRGGDMRLYLEAQVAERALLVWGSQEALEAELAKREGVKDRAKKRQFDRRMEELRLHVRSSLAPKRRYHHEHRFGDERPATAEDLEGEALQVSAEAANASGEEEEEEDEEKFCRTCLDCGFKRIYCKL